MANAYCKHSYNLEPIRGVVARHAILLMISIVGMFTTSAAKNSVVPKHTKDLKTWIVNCDTVRLKAIMNDGGMHTIFPDSPGLDAAEKNSLFCLYRYHGDIVM